MSSKVQAAQAPQLLKRASELRAKYALRGADGEVVKATLRLEVLAVHPQNRSGVFPSPAGVVDLLCSILKDKFNKAEANHKGVAVQELPIEKHAAYKEKWGAILLVTNFGISK